MNKRITITIVVIAIALAGGYFFMKGNSQPAGLVTGLSPNESQPAGSVASQESQSPVSSGTPREDSAQIQLKVQTNATSEVKYTSAGYAPAELKVKAGDMVVFKNDSPFGMWTSSALHPSHMTYSGTSLQEHCPDTANASFDACASTQPGDSWSFTFNKKGAWGYHNHVKTSHFGKIIVE